MTIESIPSPAIVVDAVIVRRNLHRMASYAAAHNLKVRPHTKTHKSVELGRMQIEFGGTGLTVAKSGEAEVMAAASDNVDLMMAYPTVDPPRCAAIAALAKTGRTIRVALDSSFAVDALAGAAQSAGATIGVLVDIDVGLHRTGVQTPQAALELAQHLDRQPGLRFDGILFYPGHVWAKPDEQSRLLQDVDALLGEALRLLSNSGLAAPIISGGSTPTAYQSHQLKHITEIRPGTYIFNDMNSVAGGFSSLDYCAARIIATVVSDAVPGQIVIDAGSKTLSSDRRHDDPANAGHGHIVEHPQAKITKLSEEHGQVDIRNCDRAPRVGERVSVIPNHICPCVNLQDRMWWIEPGEAPRTITVDARGMVT
ncbi:MAG: alanine racemase [Anaerolineae bacterium]|nr:alanine racemase [Phycisphaerae bacterium]